MTLYLPGKAPLSYDTGALRPDPVSDVEAELAALGVDPEAIAQAAKAARAELERRWREQALLYARLNPLLEKYARAWCDPNCDIVLAPAPNGVGKTTGTIILMGWTMWPDLVPECYSWFRENMALKAKKMDHSFRFISTPKELEDDGSVQKEIKKWWPVHRYESSKGRKAFTSHWRSLDSDWFGDAMTYEQGDTEFEGATRGIFIYNEPPRREIRQACVQRTRMGGMEAFPMTPLTDAAWIDDELVEASKTNPRVKVVTGVMEDACKQHSPNGHLDHDRILYLISQMDPDERPARAEGKFMHLSGVILRMDEEKHVSKVPLKSNPLWPHFQCIDPGGFNKPFAVLWGQICPEPLGGIQILREWPDGTQEEGKFEKMKSPQMKVEDYAKMFREVEDQLQIPKLHRKEMIRIMDKRFGNVQDLNEGKSLREHFSDLGFDFIDSYSTEGAGREEVASGIQCIKNYLKFDALTKLPWLLIDPCCRNLRWAVKRWALDPKTQKPRDDTWKNFCDVLRYICSHGFVFETTHISDEEWNSNAGGPVYVRGN